MAYLPRGRGSDSLVRSIVAGTASLGLTSVLGMALGLATTMVTARRFAPEVFGAYILVQVMGAFLAQVSSFGLDVSIAKFVAGASDEERRRAVIGTALLLRLLTALGASLAAWIGRRFLVTLFSASAVSKLLVFVWLLFLLGSAQDLFKSILQGCLLFLRIGITDLITGLLGLILVLAAVYLRHTGVLSLILAQCFALLVACVFAYLSIPGEKRIVVRLDLLRELVKFGFPLQLNDILHFVFTRIDTLLIAALLGPAGIAMYEVARRIPDTLSQLYQSLQKVQFAFTSRLWGLGEQRKLSRLLNDSLRLVAFASTFAAAIALVFGKDIIRLVFSEQYLPSVNVFVLLMVGISVSLIGNVLGTSLVAVGDSDKPVVINLLHTAASLAGNALLIPRWGIAGAAIASCIGSVATYPANMLFLRRRVRVTVGPHLKPLCILGVWTMPVLLLRPSAFPGKAGSVALFLLLCLLFSVVTKDDVVVFLTASGVTSWRPIRRLFSRGTEL